QQVALELLDLRTAPAVRGVLQRQRVEAELVNEHHQLRGPRVLDIHPDDVVSLPDVVMDLAGRHAALEAHAAQARYRPESTRPLRRLDLFRTFSLILGHPHPLAGQVESPGRSLVPASSHDAVASQTSAMAGLRRSIADSSAAHTSSACSQS